MKVKKILCSNESHKYNFVLKNTLKETHKHTQRQFA